MLTVLFYLHATRLALHLRRAAWPTHLLRHFRPPPFAKCAKDGPPLFVADAREIKSPGHPSRVDPMHAKKMSALMQSEAKNGTSHTRPILLRIETKAGHGAGKPVTKQIEEFTDVYSFLFWQLGVKE